MRITTIYFILIAVVVGHKNANHKVALDSHAIEKGLLKNQKIHVLGVEREYHLYIPQNTTKAPVVILLHGNRGSNDEILGLTTIKAPYKTWLDIAQKENIILIAPNGSKGSRHNGWNDCRSDAKGNPNSNDVLFIDKLIDLVQQNYDTKTSSFFVVGTSNGGHMAMRLAQEIPHKLKAFASIVASNPINSKCINSTLPISALIMNGTDDPILPYEGGQMIKQRGEVNSTQSTIDYWVNRNQTDTIPVIKDFVDIDNKDNCIVKMHLYKSGINNTEVALYKVINGGHAEPSLNQKYSRFFKRFIGEQNSDIEMANEVWNFFKAK